MILISYTVVQKYFSWQLARDKHLSSTVFDDNNLGHQSAWEWSKGSPWHAKLNYRWEFMHRAYQQCDSTHWHTECSVPTIVPQFAGQKHGLCRSSTYKNNRSPTYPIPDKLEQAWKESPKGHLWVLNLQNGIIHLNTCLLMTQVLLQYQLQSKQCWKENHHYQLQIYQQTLMN